MPSLFKKTTTGGDGRPSRWYGQYRDARGNRRVVALGPDRAAAREKLDALVRRAAQERAAAPLPEPDHIV